MNASTPHLADTAPVVAPMILTPVEAHLVAVVWPHVEDWIAAALRRVPCELTIEGLRAACLDDEARLVLIGADPLFPVAAGVVQIRTMTDGSRSCWILALGGSGLRAWTDTLETVEATAREQGCGSVEFNGRPGWARVLPRYACHVHFEKRL